jgi:hypothetical protein
MFGFLFAAAKESIILGLLLGLAVWALIHVVAIIIFKEYTVKEPRRWIAWSEVFLLLVIIAFAIIQLLGV